MRDQLTPRRLWRRAAVAMLVGGLLASLAVVAPASARDLDDRRHQVSKDIDRSSAQLDQSTQRLVRATQRQNRAEASLRQAQARLAQVRGELAAAKAMDARMQQRLDQAVTRLRRARAELSDRRRRVAEQESRLGRIAVESYQSGDPSLMALSMVLNSQDAVQLGDHLSSVQSVLDKENVALQRLEASRVVLSVQEAQLQEAKVEVAERRAEAAENLRNQERLESQAEQTRADIARLVVTAEAARKQARAARARDARQLRELEAERDRISAMLRQRARQAARAAAQARRQAREREAAAARRAAERARARDRASRSGARPSSSFLSTPVEGYLTSSYGMRMHPVYHRWSLHDGTDFGAACGTPVRAAAPGTVVAAYAHSAYGNRVIIDHGYQRGVGLSTAYNHLSGFDTYVGQRVQRGDVIGYVGTTGYSTGCHLHFMVFENGDTVDPMGWL